MKNQLSSVIQTLNSVAMGEQSADLVLKNCSLVSVYTKEILEKTQIAISKERIAYVGPDASHTIGKHTTVIDLEGQVITKWNIEEEKKPNINYNRAPKLPQT